MTVVARVEANRLRPDLELAQFVARLDGQGAIVSFVGLARPRARSGEALTRLYLDHYPGMTEASIESIVDRSLDRFPISEACVVHRSGTVLPGEPIVFVAVASDHRRDAFLAADYLMDLLKTEAVFWKREDRQQGSEWIEPNESDRADRLRWDS